MTDLRPSRTTAKLLAHSVWGDYPDTDLWTVEATFARSALAELNTHRAFSRNSASSRAIPVKKMLAQVEESPFIPRIFSLNQKGMHASEFLDFEKDYAAWEDAAKWWLESRDMAVVQVHKGLERGLHKQDVNRILEPFMLHTAIISATEWQNFFDLRLECDEKGNPLAYPPIFDLAWAIMEAMETDEYATGVYKKIYTEPGAQPDWHTPLVGFEGDDDLSLNDRLKVSAARCARVSYLTHDGVRDISADLELYNRLASAHKHLSPLEHQAHPDERGSGNFRFWKQLRWYIESRATL